MGRAGLSWRPIECSLTHTTMNDTTTSLKPWVTFAGCVLVVVVLYWAHAIFVPFALAILLTFVLTPPATWLERWVGRVPAVLVVVTLVFTVLGLAGWVVTRQMENLAKDLPVYRQNIRTKIQDVRGAGKGGAVEKLQETIEDIKTDLGTPDAPKRAASRSVVVTSEEDEGYAGFAWLGPILGPLGTAGLVLVTVIFMLLERRDLRDRLIGLIGHGQLAVTTKAFDEAAARVSRQLLMQSLVNLVYGIAAGVGLYFLAVPYPLLLASLGGALRFIPYVGPVARRRRAHRRQPCGSGRVDRTTRGDGALPRAGALHQPRARNRALCRGSGRVPGGAADVGRILDMVVGAARPAHGDAADHLPCGAWQARSRPRVRGDAHGRYACRWHRSMAITSACWRAIRARPPTSSTGTSRPNPPRDRYTTSCCCRR